MHNFLLLVVLKSIISIRENEFHVIQIVYKEVKPFIFRKHKDVADGIMPTQLRQGIKKCNMKNIKLDTKYLKNPLEKLAAQNKTTNKSYADRIAPESSNSSLLLFPYFGSTRSIIKAYPMTQTFEELEMVKTKQIAIIMHRSYISMLRKYVESIHNYSGVFILGLALSLIIIIAMSFCENTHLFTQGIPFKTILLNYWSASVTITTVGYGDRVPTTVFGRLCDTAWIGIGLVMTCSVTATICSYVLTEVNLDLQNKSIGVLNGSHEAEIASNDYPFSTIVRFNEYEDVKDAVITGSVSVGLLNADYVSWILRELNSKKVHVVKLLDYDLPVNVLLEMNNITVNLFNCLAKMKKQNELAKEYFRIECPIDTVRFDDILSLYRASWILPAITAATFLLLLSGFIYDIAKHRHVLKRTNFMRKENGRFDKKIKQLIDEVEELSLDLKIAKDKMQQLAFKC